MARRPPIVRAFPATDAMPAVAFIGTADGSGLYLARIDGGYLVAHPGERVRLADARDLAVAEAHPAGRAWLAADESAEAA
jgi:hypothetical protein